MKNLLSTIWGFIFIVFIGTTCEKGPFTEDQILYRDINPDTTMDYDTTVLYEYPFQFEGSFSYNIDLDQDGTDDFQVSGHTWPGHFDHVGVMWYNDHETRVVALNDQAFIANYDHFGPCCETDLNEGDPINDKLEWADEARLSYTIMDNVLYCNWKGDFLAVKLIKDGNNFFGWIDMDGFEIPTIKDMAVNLTHDKKILAGQKE